MPDSALAGAAVSVETEIVAVTVYPEQARVTRHGQVEVHASDMVLEVGPLPATLAPPSIQAIAQGTASVTLQKPGLEPLLSNQDWLRQEQQLSDHLHTVEDQFRICKERLAGLNQQQAFLQVLSEQAAQQFAQGLTQQSMELAQITEFMAYFERAHQRLAEVITAQERQKHELDQQLQQARQALQQFQSHGKTPSYRIRLPLTVLQSGLLHLHIVYDVTEAYWQPAYNFRLKEERSALQIDCIAEVRQNTGEDWHQVELKVSTAVPEKSPAIPDVSLLKAAPADTARAQSAHRESKKRLRSRSPGLDETYRMLGAVPGSEIPPQQDEAGSEDGGLQATSAIICFVATAPITVASDNAVYRVPVGQLELDSRLTYVALPQRCSAAYLCAALTNPSDKGPLLAGMAYLFRDGGYVGEEKCEYVAPGASFQLSLGLDERVAIQRELVTQKSQPADTVDRELRAYRLTIHNPFTHPIDVTVIEQVPFSRSDCIDLELLAAEPPITREAVDQYQWLIQLPPQASEHIYYRYEMKTACGVAGRSTAG